MLRGGDSTRLLSTIMLLGGETAGEGRSSYVKPPALCCYVLYSILVPPSANRGNAGMGHGAVMAQRYLTTTICIRDQVKLSLCIQGVWGVEEQLQSFSTSARVEWSSLHSVAVLPRGNARRNNWTKRRVDPRVCPNVLERGKLSCPSKEAGNRTIPRRWAHSLASILRHKCGKS